MKNGNSKSGSSRNVKVKSEVSKSNNMKSPEKKEKWILKLYVAGQTPRSLAAFANLKKFCDEH